MPYLYPFQQFHMKWSTNKFPARQAGYMQDKVIMYVLDNQTSTQTVCAEQIVKKEEEIKHRKACIHGKRNIIPTTD